MYNSSFYNNSFLRRSCCCIPNATVYTLRQTVIIFYIFSNLNRALKTRIKTSVLPFSRKRDRLFAASHRKNRELIQNKKKHPHALACIAKGNSAQRRNCATSSSSFTCNSRLCITYNSVFFFNIVRTFHVADDNSTRHYGSAKFVFEFCS